jgi:hypothetical protein
VLHQIGVGTLGPVFRTYEPIRDRLVAVKVFRLDIIPEQAQALADALTRATHASLFHPSIVEPIAAGVEGTLAYRAEEYVAAESLDVAMRHYAPAAIEKGLPFITQLAGAIDFARAAGVGHGGLHPRDVFVTPDEARATGFGVIEALEAVGVRAPVRRPYTAPERIDGAPWGIAADVFSLAAIAFELLTGRRPAGTGAGIGALPDSPHRDALHGVLARAMDPDPANRFPNALAFAAALEAASRGEPAAASSIGATATPPLAAVATTSAAETPGEFAIETQLDPLHAALAESLPPAVNQMQPPIEPAEVAAPPAVIEEPEDTRPFIVADGEPDRLPFADDFVEEQADPEIRRPLEAVGETVPPLARDFDSPGYGPASAAPLREAAVEERMLGADPEPEVHERSRSPVLPSALIGILGLLGGFAAGAYYMSGRDRPAAPPSTVASEAPASQAQSPAQTPSVPAGPATADKAGQYSEQKIAPPAATAESRPQPTEGSRPAPHASGAAADRTVRGAKTGRLVVQSTPSRAAVTINGKWRGRTPLTIDDLAFGSYTVRVVQPGYRIAREDVRMSAANASHTFAPRLEPEPRPAAPVSSAPPAAPRPANPAPRPGSVAPSSGAGESFTGSIYVDSRPRGATVLVDGRSVGQTPLSVPGVPIGSHVVRIEMEGKQPWSAATRVVAGAIARVTGSLEDK